MERKVRLIDANKLPVFDMTDNIAGENGSKAIVTHWIQFDFITHAPTIEAIPVEWIEQWEINYNEKLPIEFRGRTCVSDMLEDWEKEEGTNNG